MGNLKNRLDVLVAFGVIGIILMIIIPLPSFLLDILLVVNITLSVLILLMTLFSTNILQLSVFPTLLFNLLSMILEPTLLPHGLHGLN